MWKDGAFFWISLGKKKKVYLHFEKDGNRFEIYSSSWPRDEVRLDPQDTVFASPPKGLQEMAETNLT